MAHDRTETRQQLVKGSTLGAAVLLGLALFVMVNYLAFRHYRRFDWTKGAIYSLSERSLSVLDQIERPIEAITYFSGTGSDLSVAVDELLSRYEAARPDRFKKRVLDPARNLLEAQQLVETHEIDRENVVILATEDDRRVIDGLDLAEYDYSGAQLGQAPTLKEFKGEQLITSAILELVEDRKRKVLFTTGHGEGQLTPGSARSMMTAKDLLGKDNFEIEEWKTLGAAEVPEGTDLLVVAGPSTGFLAPELDLFSAYLESGGRMLLLLDPVFGDGDGLVDVGLREWLLGYGVELGDDIVIDPDQRLPLFGAETIFTDSYGFHPIVESFQAVGQPVIFALARSVSRSEEPEGRLEVTELVRTSAAGWGESDLAALPEVEQGEGDRSGPVSLAVAVSFPAELGGDGSPLPPPPPADDEPISPEEIADESAGRMDEEAEGDGDDDLETVDLTDAPAAEEPEARLVVFGDFDFASDGQVVNAGNAGLLLNTFNWLVKREQLLPIEARPLEPTRLNLTQAQHRMVTLLSLLVLPSLGIAAGIVVYVRRRR